MKKKTNAMGIVKENRFWNTNVLNIEDKCCDYRKGKQVLGYAMSNCDTVVQ